MAATGKLLSAGVTAQLGVTFDTLYTAQANGKGARVTASNFLNTSASVETYTLHLVQSGDSPTDVNIIVDGYRLEPQESDQPPGLANQHVPAGATLQAKASTAASITVTISGTELS